MNVVLITGANRGIGKALADYYLKSNFIVYAGTRNLTSIIPSHKNLKPVILDIADDESIHKAAQVIKNEAGHVDILINNAGVSRVSGSDDHPELVSNLSTLDRSKLLNMFNINTISALLVSKNFAPIMMNPDAFIINISSIRATYANSANGNGNYGYSASKIALNMMTLCLANDLPDNISTFAVHPGSVRTDMNPNGAISTKESAISIASIINSWNPDNNGKFLNYNGDLLNS
jgi:NAD(P)-dependent dehydrogenase (short-subunit alcohol dehydrogenase family)